MSHFTMGSKQGLAKPKQSGQIVELPGAAQTDSYVRIEAAFLAQKNSIVATEPFSASSDAGTAGLSAKCQS